MKLLTRYKQNVVSAALLEGNSNLAANDKSYYVDENQSAIKYLP